MPCALQSDPKITQNKFEEKTNGQKPCVSVIKSELIRVKARVFRQKEIVYNCERQQVLESNKSTSKIFYTFIFPIVCYKTNGPFFAQCSTKKQGLCPICNVSFVQMNYESHVFLRFFAIEKLLILDDSSINGKRSRNFCLIFQKFTFKMTIASSSGLSHEFGLLDNINVDRSTFVSNFSKEISVVIL